MEQSNTTRIKVAIIDSGVSKEQPDLKDCEINFYRGTLKNNRWVCEKYVSNDLYGHGTACAWIINKNAPSAEIVSIQVLDENGSTDSEAVVCAVDWCISHGISIINLSMGCCSRHSQERFLELGKKAASKGVLIFAAMNDEGLDAIPATLPFYIGVYDSNKTRKDTYVWDANTKRAGAYGRKQRVGWPSYPYYTLLGGSSFATAHMVAIAVKLRQRFPAIGYEKLMVAFSENAEQLVNDSYSKQTSIESLVESHNSKLFTIKKASIYGYTKEMHAVVNFCKLTGIDIIRIFDHVRTRNVGKQINCAGQKIIIESINAVASVESDTLIISKLSKFNELIQEDTLKIAIEFGIMHNQNIYSLEYIDYNMYPDLFMAAEAKGLKIRHPMIGEKELSQAKAFREIYGHIGDEIPIVGIFGTGTSQGKFTLQLRLREKLLAQGYCVKNLGTEMHSELFGFESYYPVEILQSIKFSQWDMMEYLQGEVRRLEIEYPKPDLVIVGSQSGTIPKTYTIKNSIGTLPSIAFLMGTVPHVYILVVNPNDEAIYYGHSCCFGSYW